ncbi:flagellar basal body rod protein FlgB [Silvanigrella sp.]|jgi:flagellar basal-body rod protein FlgB|uniref:flagellar basal body rod protein FlgB n=1 Tax=Silvanigrella sp. TaxID=2024976 RepID=UPI0037C84E44
MSSVVGNQIFGKHDAVLEESLNQRLKRQNVNVANISNSLTPGYRALGFEFEKQLQAAIGSDKDLIMKVSDSRHIKAPGMGADGVLKPDLFVKPTESIGNDGNTVDVDQEMTEVAGNQIIYKATIETLNRKLGMLRYAINGGR